MTTCPETRHLRFHAPTDCYAVLSPIHNPKEIRVYWIIILKNTPQILRCWAAPQCQRLRWLRGPSAINVSANGFYPHASTSSASYNGHPLRHYMMRRQPSRSLCGMGTLADQSCLDYTVQPEYVLKGCIAFLSAWGRTQIDAASILRSCENST